MDQLPLEFRFELLVGDVSELLYLLELDKRIDWKWLIDDINNQLKEHIKQLTIE